MESQKPVTARPRWTPAERKQFRDMLDGGKTAKEIFRKLKRTFQAIYARLRRVYKRRPRA
jgi:hypothetical protein